MTKYIVAMLLIFFMILYGIYFIMNQRCKAIYGPEYKLVYDICLPRKDLK